MYKDDPNLKKPDDENVQIWRYMDMWKFMNMLATSSLHFTRADCLDDPLEGSWQPSKIYEAYKEHGEQYINELKYWEKEFRKTAAVNCWHINDSESEKMWKLFVPSGEGIVIQSTYGLLKNEMQQCNEGISFIGMMQYIDYEKEKFESCTPYTLGRFTDFFTYKDKNFKHENELRAVIMAMEEDKDHPAKSISEKGIKLKVNLSKLMNAVYISPDSEDSKLELLKKLVSDYKVDTKVMASSLHR
jgi:hypothetical protein